jgi:hypothetical protein
VVLLELFVFVLHENRAIDDIDNTDGVSATGGNLGRGFGRVVGVRLEHHLPDLAMIKIEIEYSTCVNVS